MKVLFGLAAIIGVVSASSGNSVVSSLECWLNSKCDVNDPEYGQYCNNHTYDEGSCYPMAGSNYSVKFSCTSDNVHVQIFNGYGCTDTKPTSKDFATNKCEVAIRGFNTIYKCTSADSTAYLRSESS